MDEINTVLKFISVVILIIAGVIFAKKFQKTLCETSIQKELTYWYIQRMGNRFWKCIEIIVDNSGPFGEEMRWAVLQKGKEQIKISSESLSLREGVSVALRLRTEDEKGLPSISFLDTYLRAEVITTTA